MQKALAFALVALGVAPGLSVAEEPTIEEILVVARKRPEPLQRVPLSVSVQTGEQLLRSGSLDLFDVARRIPALDVFQNAGPLNTGFRIRRIGNEPNIPNFEPAVGLFVDGAFRTRSGTGVNDLIDIDRIEVLRGPQSTLYGKNTTAGLISVFTKPPADSTEMRGEISTGRIEGYEDADMLRLVGVFNMPVTEAVSGRLSGAWFDHGHTMANLFSGDDSQDMQRYSIRGQLLYEPSDAMTARLIVGHFVIDAANTGEFEIDEATAIAAINAGFGVPCPVNDSTDRAFCNNRAALTDLETNDLTLLFDYGTPHITFTSISGYEEYSGFRDFDADQLNIELLDIFDRQESTTFSQELRLAARDGSGIDWIGGLFYLDNDFTRGDPDLATAMLGPAAPLLELGPGLPYGQPGDSGFMTSRSSTEHFSVFGNVIWPISDGFSLIAGARWLTEDKRTMVVNTADHMRPTLITLGIAPMSGDADESRDTSGWAWSLTGERRWSDDVMSYVLVSQGLKSGGFNGAFSPSPGASREYDDEQVTSIELGTKAMLLDRRMRLNVSVFAAEYDDFQSAGFVSLRFRVNNAEEVDVTGIEVDLQALLGERWSMTAGASYADAEYARYTGGSCYAGRPPDNADGSACVLSGSTLPLAPRWKTAANVDYARPVAIGEIYARIDWTWVDRYYTNASLDPRHVQPSYHLINLRSGLRVGGFDVSAWLHNAGDETVVMQDGPTNLFAGDPAYARFLGSPRSYGVTLRYGW